MLPIHSICWTLLALFFSVSFAGDPIPYCFGPQEGMGAPKPLSCHRLAEEILYSPKSREPTRFSKDPNKGLSLPHEWKNDQCYVYLDFYPEHEQRAFFPIQEVAFAVDKIITECVEDPKTEQLGGRMAVGYQWRVFVAITRHHLPDESEMGNTTLSISANNSTEQPMNRYNLAPGEVETTK